MYCNGAVQTHKAMKGRRVLDDTLW